MKHHILTILVLVVFNTLTIYAQDKIEYLEAQATITALTSKVRARNSTEKASITFVTQGGDTILCSAKLLHIPFLGSFKKVGDQITVNYQKSNPYLVQSTNELFVRTYGLYILIGFGVVISAYRIIKISKNKLLS
ncbi:DUF3592 domain-containing protein [Algibacter lectus]|uniref:DUF3592 domain-containing protein n=1 Tax=Algibacter lectus TaxID=221126 RepID=UPI0026EE2939|nr:DUF3592 domain-containing protein [Algibacter lectus]MDO7135939.1 hypothetical protein [Algibacter lectus]